MKKQNYYYLNDRWRDWDTSITKSLVKDVLSTAKKETKMPLKDMNVLDVGCGGGTYSFAIEKKVKKVVSVEPYKDAYLQALENKKRLKSAISVHNVVIEKFVSSTRFDLVMSITTLEHMPNPKASFKQIFNLMKPGGIIYLTVPNKLWPIEVHYKLPFLSWLPLPIANRYLKLSGLANTYEDSSYAMTYWGIKNFFDQYPCTYYFKIPDADAAYLGLGDTSRLYTAIKILGIKLITRWPIFWAFSKGFILVIKKNA